MIDLLHTANRWPKVPLEALCEIRGGVPAPQDETAFRDGVIPFVRMRDVGRYHFTNDLHETDGRLSREYCSEKRYEITPKGSILMPRSGSVGLNHRAILTVDAVVVSHLCALIPTSPDVSVDFLYRFLCLVDMRKLTKKTTGLDSIAFSDLRQVSVPLPPLPEQCRIAAILDKADELRAKRRAAAEQLNELTQAMFLEMFGDPATNPFHFPMMSLKDLFVFRTGKLDSNAAVANGRYPFFTCSRDDLRIDDYAFDCEALLLAGNNANADYSVKHYSGRFNAYQRTYVVTLRDATYSYEFARFALEYQLAEMKRRSKGTGTKYLTLEILNRMSIPVPPVEAQHEFSGRLAAAGRVQAIHHSSTELLEGLFSGLQSRAFSGAL